MHLCQVSNGIKVYERNGNKFHEINHKSLISDRNFKWTENKNQQNYIKKNIYRALKNLIQKLFMVLKKKYDLQFIDKNPEPPENPS